MTGTGRYGRLRDMGKHRIRLTLPITAVVEYDINPDSPHASDAYGTLVPEQMARVDCNAAISDPLGWLKDMSGLGGEGVAVKIDVQGPSPEEATIELLDSEDEGYEEWPALRGYVDPEEVG